MEQDFDFLYDTLPSSWLFCFNDSCPQAGECIRHLSSRHIPDDKTRGYAVYPNARKAGQCPYFKKIRRIRLAYGFNTIFHDIKSKDENLIRVKIKFFLGGHSKYYRYNNGKKMLTPEQQEWIISLFRQFGYTENLVFDHYVDSYDFS